MYPEKLERQEEKYIARFGEHPVLAGLGDMRNTDLEQMLLQRSVFSLEYFEPFYNTAIRAVVNEEGKKIARGIVTEEYRGEENPNHREDAVTDLKLIGIDEGIILTTEMTDCTKIALALLRQLVTFTDKDSKNRKLYDVRALTALRFGGEVMAGEEYALLCPELQRRYDLTPEKSVFYWPHRGHDQKKKKFGEKGSSHADRFGEILVEIIDSPEALEVAMRTIKDSFVARTRFYDQFSKC